MNSDKSLNISKILLFSFLIINGLYWAFSNNMRAKWPGVPPVPSYQGALAMTLGDPQFSYRMGALTLQNLGDTGGSVTPLKDYDYQMLKHWFWLLHKMDAKSDHVSMAAAYYFGATQVPEDINVIVDYLSEAGNNAEGEKWRWLAHAVFLARYRMHDLEYALELAYKLADLQNPDMPIWARQMPIFVLTALGEKEAAKTIIESLLATESQNLHPNEVNFMQSFIEERLQEDSPAEDKFGETWEDK